MCQIAFSIPDAVLFETKMSKEESLDFARKAVALKYYTSNGVSLGYCAQIAGMTKEDFIKYLGENKVSVFNFDDEYELMEEFTNA